MASPAEHDTETNLARPVLKRRRWVYRGAVALLIVLLALVAYGWVQREQLARDLIGEQLAELDLPATYNVEDISTNRQVLTDIVIGDPADPDLTVERVEVALAYGFGVPEIGRITLFKPRVYGSYRDGKLSFGKLDSIIFAESDDPAGLPAWDIKLIDGRGRIDSDFGAVGVKVEGEGQLDDGFKGIAAAIAPELMVGDCTAQQVSSYGEVSTESGLVTLSGPTRIGALRCGVAGLALDRVGLEATSIVSADLAGISIDGSISTGAMSASTARSAGISGPLKVAFSDGSLTSTFELSANDIASDQIAAKTLMFDGALRARNGFATASLDIDVEGQGIDLAQPTLAQLDELSRASEGTLLKPLLTKFRGALSREIRGADLSASVIGRQDGERLSLTIPQGDIRNQGATLLSLSRLQYLQNGAQTPKITGNFRVGGRDLPPLVGRMEFAENGQSLFRMRMDEYRAGSSSVAIPEMLVTQNAVGNLTFAGGVEASGPLPGGQVRGLRMPVSGAWNSNAGLSVWRQCTDIAFQNLAFANLELASRRVKLCPSSGSAIVRQDASGLRIAAGTPSLDIAGTLAGTPIRLASGPVGVAYPGIATAKAIDISLGPKGEASRFIVSDVLARLDDGIAGTFTDADIGLFAVPIDLNGSAGEWDYTDGVLSITEGQFTLTDRAEIPRYEPLVARGATLTLEDSIIRASAVLRAPESDREVSKVAILHNLSSGTGSADLAVDNLLFDDVLQPEDLSYLAADVAANVKGVVTGSGRIDWNSQDVTSSGAFTSQSLDFAALFGPVRGASGTVEFTDLLNLTTAPDQRIRVKSVNPGIEARDGEIGFSLTDGQFLGVTGGKWPFMGGTLTLRPVNLNLSAAEERRYVLVVEGLDSGLFIQNMELGNLTATGIFDGELPIVFDELGFGNIEGGVLKSRGGGNVSYVGELTYEDLSPIADYAFQMLRSLDYSSMDIAIEGPLTGDIVTNLTFEGVSQGAGTKQNIVTRQLAKLPIRFNVNIKAPFYNLVGVLKSIYDPATVRDPRDLGLFSVDGARFVPVTPQSASQDQPPSPPPKPQDERPPLIPAPTRPDESAIQTSDSESQP